VSGLGDKRELLSLVAIAELRRYRKTIALQREASAYHACEATHAARQQKVGTMLADIATFRQDHLQSILGDGAGRELLSRGIDVMVHQRALQLIKMVEDRKHLAQAKVRMHEAARWLSIEDERLKLHRHTLNERLLMEAEQLDEGDD
jgi:hypothetical protein